ncbi:MAG: hypothetical protein WBB34_20810 [Xanthobacteraceae bacterium]
MPNETMFLIGRFCLPILIWIAMAWNISTMRPPAKATALQEICMLGLAAMYALACATLAKKMLYDLRSRPLALLALLEMVVIGALIYLQVRAKAKGI